VLKCDIKKFFASIDHATLLGILKSRIPDQNTLWLLKKVIESFSTSSLRETKLSLEDKGLPLGNLTSQLLVNIYMNEFDQFVKHKLKVKYYIRYADDFALFSNDKKQLEVTLKNIEAFLGNTLKLQLHPNKVSIATFSSGVDFLGWVHFVDHRVLRTASKRRMFRRLAERKGSIGEGATKQSYLGMLGHGNGRKLSEKINAG
jgi:retron-type reverse transcriptase